MSPIPDPVSSPGSIPAHSPLLKPPLSRLVKSHAVAIRQLQSALGSRRHRHPSARRHHRQLPPRTYIDIPGSTFLINCPRRETHSMKAISECRRAALVVDVSNPASPLELDGSGNGQAANAGTTAGLLPVALGDSSLALLCTGTKLTDGSVGSRLLRLAFVPMTVLSIPPSTSPIPSTWSTSTFLQVGSSIPTAAGPGVLFTDSSGRSLCW